MFYTYILKSQLDHSYYVGSTSDLDKRIIKHNQGGSRYTKSKKPWSIVYSEEYATLSEARKRENYLKSLKSRVAIEKLIDGPFVYR